jgi:hypothetical protein
VSNNGNQPRPVDILRTSSPLPETLARKRAAMSLEQQLRLSLAIIWAADESAKIKAGTSTTELDFDFLDPQL